jgi:hypothetical protein
MAGLRGSKKVRDRAVELRQALADGGVPVSHAEAVEMILGQVETIARNLGVTERTAVENYVTGPVMEALVRACLAAGAEHAQALYTADTLTLSITDAGHVTVALGVIIKLVAQVLDERPHDADALGIATDAADAVVGVGHALRSPTADTVTLEGAHAVYARRVLTQAIEHLRSSSWTCPGHRHTPGTDCDVTDALVQDLHRVGGWISPDHTERPADNR